MKEGAGMWGGMGPGIGRQEQRKRGREGGRKAQECKRKRRGEGAHGCGRARDGGWTCRAEPKRVVQRKGGSRHVGALGMAAF